MAPAENVSSGAEPTHCSEPAAPSSPHADDPDEQHLSAFRAFMDGFASEQAADGEDAAAEVEKEGSRENAASSSTTGGAEGFLEGPVDTASGAPQEADNLEHAVILLDAVGSLAQEAMLNVWHRTHIAGSYLPQQGQDFVMQDEQRLTELLAILIEGLPGNAISTIKNIVKDSDFSEEQRDIWEQWVDVAMMHVLRNRPLEPHRTGQSYHCFAPEQTAESKKQQCRWRRRGAATSHRTRPQ